MKPWIVVGGGFQGIIAASLLLRKNKRVILIERAPFLGAVLNSHEQEGLFLDNGCHVFSNQCAESTDLWVEIMQDCFHAVDVRYASVTDENRAEELAVADFSHLPVLERGRILYEIANTSGDAPPDDNFANVLSDRFGPTLAEHLRTGVKKMTLREPEALAANTLQKSPFGRVSVTGQRFGNFLKMFDAYDSTLAVSSQGDPARFYPDAASSRDFNHFYPAEQGTKGFCVAAEAYLRDGGADIRLGQTIAAISEENNGLLCVTGDGETIEAEGMIWALEPGALSDILWGNNLLQEYAVRVPMALYYFLVPAEDDPNYTYIHDFSAGTNAFRVSSPGFYGKQANSSGLSYLCAEVPAVMDSEIWQDPERISSDVWREMVDLKMTDRKQPDSAIIRKNRMSYPLHAPGYEAAVADLVEHVGRAQPRITLADPNLFSKVGITRSLRAKINGAAA